MAKITVLVSPRDQEITSPRPRPAGFNLSLGFKRASSRPLTPTMITLEGPGHSSKRSENNVLTLTPPTSPHSMDYALLSPPLNTGKSRVRRTRSRSSSREERRFQQPVLPPPSQEEPPSVEAWSPAPLTDAWLSYEAQQFPPIDPASSPRSSIGDLQNARFPSPAPRHRSVSPTTTPTLAPLAIPFAPSSSPSSSPRVHSPSPRLWMEPIRPLSAPPTQQSFVIPEIPRSVTPISGDSRSPSPDERRSPVWRSPAHESPIGGSRGSYFPSPPRTPLPFPTRAAKSPSPQQTPNTGSRRSMDAVVPARRASSFVPPQNQNDFDAHMLGEGEDGDYVVSTRGILRKRAQSSFLPTPSLKGGELIKPLPPLLRPTTFWRKTKRSGVTGASYSPSSHLIRRSTFIAAGLQLDRPTADQSAFGVEARLLVEVKEVKELPRPEWQLA